ncbi:MAG: lytic transglycosylase domain-containing protein [Micromonosporaceae bacterium]
MGWPPRRPSFVARWRRGGARLIAVLVLLLGALGGGYLGFRQHTVASGHSQTVDVRVAEVGQFPLDVVDARRRAAFGAAQVKAANAAAEVAAKAKRAEDLAKRDATASRSQTRSSYPVPASCKEYTGNRALGCALLLDAGFALDQMPCLERLWTKESGWNHLARNTSSGAYGIPQALPGDKMAAYGADWRTNPVPQIKWGLSYVKGRYGTPCGAWSFWLAHNWY